MLMCQFLVHRYSNISIPLYELNEGRISVPISLSYHAGGIRVAEEASWVGLGWSLNAGGVITRTVRDKDDFGFKFQCVERGGYYDEFDELLDVFPSDPDNLGWDSYEQIEGTQLPTVYMNQFDVTDDQYQSNGNGAEDVVDLFCEALEYDYEPDIYSYNFLGDTGQFVLNKEKQFIPLSDHDIAIEFQESTESWVVTTSDGLKFYFGNTTQSKEYTYYKNYAFTTDVVTPFGGTQYPSQTNALLMGVWPTTSIDLEDQYSYCPDPSELVCEDSHISSWYLTKIESPAEEAEIDFTYLRTEKGIEAIPSFSEEFTFPNRFSYLDCEGEVAPVMETRSKTALLQVTRYDNVRLSSIESDWVSLEFNEESDREDLIGGTRLSEIIIEHDEAYYKKIIFENNSYFISDDMDEEFCWQYLLQEYEENGYMWSDFITEDNNLKRLKLESVVIEGLNNETLPDYSFEYNDEELPPKTSMSVDFWGYANGSASGGAENLTLVPTYYFHDPSSLSVYEAGCSTLEIIGQCDPVYFRGGDRRANATYAQAATLESILLPTGATHSMTYELNEFQNSLPEAFSRDISMDQIGEIDASNYSSPSAFQTTIVVKSNGSECQKTPVYLQANWSFQNSTECETNPRVKVSKSGFSETVLLTPLFLLRRHLSIHT
jgi:hypothetical protein